MHIRYLKNLLFTTLRMKISTCSQHAVDGKINLNKRKSSKFNSRSLHGRTDVGKHVYLGGQNLVANRLGELDDILAE